MIRLALAFLFALLPALVALPAVAWLPNGTIEIWDDHPKTGSNPGEGETTINIPGHSTGYFVVKTSSISGTITCEIESRHPQTFGTGPSADTVTTICTMTGITTNTTTVALIGSAVGAGEGITDVCDFPLSSVVYIDCNGGTADLDAIIQTVVDF
jgi:hypothetical protein